MREDLMKDVLETQSDIGLLILRGAAFFLAATFGLQKLAGYVTLIHSGEPAATHFLVPLIGSMGFPVPTLLAIYVTLIESVGALLIACGLLTRVAAALAALSMAGAFYTSLRLGEEPLRAALYLIIFAALAVTGPGKFSVDGWLKSRAEGGALRAVGKLEVMTAINDTSAGQSNRRIDAGLLTLRIGVGLTFVLLFALRQSQGPQIFAHPGHVAPLILMSTGALLITCGLWTRPAALALALTWAWALLSGLEMGQEWFSLPYRAAVYLLLFAALLFTGSGKFSIDHMLPFSKPKNKFPPWS
jgi:putative oxidoreductase